MTQFIYTTIIFITFGFFLIKLIAEEVNPKETIESLKKELAVKDFQLSQQSKLLTAYYQKYSKCDVDLTQLSILVQGQKETKETEDAKQK